MPAVFLDLQDVKTHFPVERGLIFKRRLGTVKAVDGISLSLRRGEVLGLVGESGCGKSTLGRTILQLVRATSGTVVLEGKNLNRLNGSALRRARRFPDDFPGSLRVAQSAHDRVRHPRGSPSRA